MAPAKTRNRNTSLAVGLMTLDCSKPQDRPSLDLTVTASEFLPLKRLVRLGLGPMKWFGLCETLSFLDYKQVVHGRTLDRVSLAAGPVHLQPVDLGG
jgi:hypothetical protein